MHFCLAACLLARSSLSPPVRSMSSVCELKQGYIQHCLTSRCCLLTLQTPDASYVRVQRGRRFSLPGRTVSLVLPGSSYQAADVQRFADAAAAADLSLLEIAWAVAAEEVRSYSLQEMAKLLFDDDAALPQYITFSMLLHDAIYFKQVSGTCCSC
eukprot:GHRQ01033134.1.p1 GENE.GHRQ01033134.1~~GHRQ01033134.1.p1  ORF type:complete len:155 (-),score=60.34 GHRQ01033134.1:559-1023(-)